LIVNGRPEPSQKRYVAEELTDRAIRFIETHRSQPFALYLAHKNVHHPFTPDAPEQGRYRDQPIELPDGSHSWTNMTNACLEGVGGGRNGPPPRRSHSRVGERPRRRSISSLIPRLAPTQPPLVCCLEP
jgi:hypothetical protein